jgi:F-box protein 11
LIEGNKIEHNQGPGIKIGIANKTSIIRNEIRQNQNGIEFISADPYIYMNKIVENFENGILAKSYNLKYAPRRKPKLLR